MKRTLAFTLIELLVVVAIIGALIAILIPSLSKARNLATRTKCAANLAGLGKSCVVYAAANGDQLPQFTGASQTFWFHDVPVAFGDALILAGSPTFNTDNLANNALKKMFYCPSRLTGDGTWSYPNAGNTQYRSIGYATLVNRPAGSMPSLVGVRATPLLEYRTKMTTVNFASAKELMLDDIISADPSGTTQDTWTTAMYNGQPNHMKGKLPEGANELCCDGHVEWRQMKFSGSAPQKAVSVQVSGAPDYNWFPNP